MSVKINIPSYMQYFTAGTKAVEVDGKTVNDCLFQLTERFPEIRKILFNGHGEIHSQMLNYISVFINGVAIEKEELENPVNDGDNIDLVYVILGG